MAKAKKQQDGTDDHEKAAAAKPAKGKKAAAPAEPTVTAKATPQPAGEAVPSAKMAAGKKPAEASRAAAPPAAAAPASGNPAATLKKPAAAAAPAASKPAANKPAAAKPAAIPPAPSFPGIDTGLAARSAANYFANRDPAGNYPRTGGPAAATAQTTPATAVNPEPKVESGSFKQLKQNLTQPGAALNKLLGIPGGAKKAGGPFAGSGGGFGPGGNNPFGGGAASKVGVPRRTNG